MIHAGLEFIETSARRMVELERLLCSIPAIAPESEGKGEWEKSRALVEWLKKRGISEIVEYNAPDPRVPGGLRPNFVATIKGASSERRLWIMSHLDVVPPGELSLWKSDPWKLVEKDGCLYGRGVEDNQQGLVSSVFAALALVELGITPPHDVKLLFMADEEVGSAHGMVYLVNHHSLFKPDDLILIPDGGCDDGSEIEIAEKNLLWLKIQTKGLQAHGSMPQLAKNAFLAACDLALRLSRMGEVFSDRDPLFTPDYSTFCPTKKEANVPNINTIPGDDVFYMDMRILPQYPLALVKKEIDARVALVEAEYGVKISTESQQSVESPATKQDAPIALALSKAIREEYKVEPKFIGIGGGTVGASLRQKGYPCIIWSRISETAHQPNEHVKIADLIGDAKVMFRLMMRE